MTLLSEFRKGLLSENPIFRLVLGLCPSLAVTTAVINGLWMGLATTFVLLGSNFLISLLRNVIPENVRIPAFIVVIASFVTIVDEVMHAYLPSIHSALGIFIPLIVVNCIILGRAEAFAAKHPVVPSVMDGLGMGVGFTGALLIIASVREILGAGTFFGLPLFGENFQPAIMMILPPGGFLTLGVLLSIINYWEDRQGMLSRERRRRLAEEGGHHHHA